MIFFGLSSEKEIDMAFNAVFFKTIDNGICYIGSRHIMKFSKAQVGIFTS